MKNLNMLIFGIVLSTCITVTAGEPSYSFKRIKILNSKIILNLDLLNNTNPKNIKTISEIVSKDLLAELDSLHKWFSVSEIMIVGTAKSSPGLPESEIAANIRGKISEMRLALDGYAEALPNDASLIQKLQVVNTLARDCQILANRIVK